MIISLVFLDKFYITIGKGCDEMVLLYTNRIIKGRMLFSAVPTVLKQKVADELILADCEHLINDPAYLPVVPEEPTSTGE